MRRSSKKAGRGAAGGVFKRKSLVQMEYPFDAYEDRFTGRIFEVVRSYGPFATVKNPGASLQTTFAFRASSLVPVEPPPSSDLHVNLASFRSVKNPLA